MALLTGRRLVARLWIAAALTVAVSGAVIRPLCAVEAHDEYDVKAAILFNFVRFVQWPEAAFEGEGDPILIAIVGEDPFGDGLDGLVRDKQVEGRGIRVVRWRRLDQIGRCHVAFVSRSERDRCEQVLDRLGPTTLTVAEFSGFTDRGGIVQFATIDLRVRFEINLAAVERAQLTMSSRLLALARIVAGGP